MRRKDREVTNTEDILHIIDQTTVLRLGLFDDEYPYIVPMNFGYTFSDGTLNFYMHCAREGHKLDLIRKNPHVCIELEGDTEAISGGDVACRYGTVYSSVIGRGTARLLEGEEERLRGLHLIMAHMTGRSFDISGRMIGGLEIIEVTVPDFTAKARKKPA